MISLENCYADDFVGDQILMILLQDCQPMIAVNKTLHLPSDNVFVGQRFGQHSCGEIVNLTIRPMILLAQLLI